MNFNKRLDKILVIGLFVLIIGILFIIDTASFSYKLLFESIIVGILLFFLFVKIFNSKIIYINQKALLIFLFYFFFIGFAYFLSNYRFLSFLVLSKIIAYSGCFFIMFFLFFNNPKDDKRHFFLLKLTKLIFFSSVILSIYGIIQYLGLDFLGLYKDWYRGYYEIFSTLGNPIFLASFVSIATPFGFCLIILEKKFINKILFCIGLLLTLICLFLTFSRSGYIVFVFTILIFLGIIFRKKTNLNFLRFCLIFFAIFFVLNCFLYIFLRNNPNFIGFLQKETARIYIWQGTLNAIFNNFLVGQGLGNFVLVFPEYRPIELLNFHPVHMAYVKHAHNFFLETWLELGLLGIISLGILIVFFILKGFKYLFKPNISKENFYILTAAISSFLGLIFMNLTSVGIYYPVEGTFFWLLLGMIYIISIKKYKFVLNKSFKVLLSSIILTAVFIVLYTSFLVYPLRNVNKPEPVFIESYDIDDSCFYMIKEQKWQELIDCYKDVKFSVKDFYICNNMANGYFFIGDYEKAYNIYTVGLKSYPYNTTLLYNLSLASFRMGKIQESVQIASYLINSKLSNKQLRYFIYKLAK